MAKAIPSEKVLRELKKRGGSGIVELGAAQAMYRKRLWPTSAKNELNSAKKQAKSHRWSLYSFDAFSGACWGIEAQFSL